MPVWESKLLHQFDHRFSSYGPEDWEQPKEIGDDGKATVEFASPRWWVHDAEVHTHLDRREWKEAWFAGYRDITNATNERTAIAAILPSGGACQPLNLFFPETALHAVIWLAAMNSFALDFVVRQRIGGLHLNITTCRQLPIPAPDQVPAALLSTIRNCVLELVFTSRALLAFAESLGHAEPPFVWNASRRFEVRCELDAALFLVYGITKVDADYILETFPIVRAKEQQAFGVYRSKQLILECYDRLQAGTVHADGTPGHGTPLIHGHDASGAVLRT